MVDTTIKKVNMLFADVVESWGYGKENQNTQYLDIEWLFKFAELTYMFYWL